MGNLGSYLDKFVPILGGLYFGFIYPRSLNKKLDKIDEMEKKDKEIKKMKLLRYVGILLIFLGIIEFL